MNENLYYYKKYSHHISTKKYSETICLINDIFSDINTKFPDKVKRNIVSLIVGFIRYDGVMAITRRNSIIASKKSVWYTYRYAIIALNELLEKGFIILKSKGFWNKKYEKGISSVYEVTDKFKEVFKESVKDLEMNEIKGIKINKSNKSKLVSKVSKYLGNNSNLLHNGTLQIHEVENQVDLLNKEYFNDIHLEFPFSNDIIIKNVQLTRVFTEYGKLIACGRFAQQGGNSYLTMPKTERINMLINGQRTKECDYSGLFPNILYNISQIQSPYEDNYIAIMDYLNIDKSDKQLRSIIKITFNIMLNAYSYGSYVKSFNMTYSERKGIPRKNLKLSNYEKKLYLESRGLNLKTIWDATFKVHPQLSMFIATGVGVILQTIESDIINNVLFRLKSEKITGIPIHDCMICNIGFEEQVKNIMMEEYKNYMGFDIGVKI